MSSPIVVADSKHWQELMGQAGQVYLVDFYADCEQSASITFQSCALISRQLIARRSALTHHAA